MRPALASLLLLSITAVASAQPDKDKLRPITGRAAIVNYGLILSKYDKAQKFKKNVEATLAPLKAEGKKHQDQIDAWQKRIAERDFARSSEEQLRTKIDTAKKQLEALNADI